MIKRVVQCDYCDAEAEMVEDPKKAGPGLSPWYSIPDDWLTTRSLIGDAKHLCPNHEITPKKPRDYNFGPNKCTTCGLTYAACIAKGTHPTA